ncbi:MULTISPECIES: hypothetical protein [unclassified Staphylococcus]|uniref:hypothetical protein n=1 Tax=unclassified Staphylococcus TaxID=91994 RepID=UPI000B0DC5EC|nr:MULTISPECIES: hypothetical protein [unclassified Staphylococcus]
MENADLAIGAKKVLILATNLPISTPYKLEDAIKELEERGAKVKLITPSKAVFDKLNELGGIHQFDLTFSKLEKLRHLKM